MKNKHLLGYNALLAALLAFSTGASAQQTSTAPATKAADSTEEPVFKLSPFEVSSESEGYTSATTLAGNRLNTEVRDIGNAVTVINSQFLKDIGATDNQTLLQYTTNTEVGSVFGNFVGAGDGALLDESTHFTNPNQNTRIRGLTSADNTRDYFLTDIPWDAYNVDGVDLQRGPNSILFGQGSPAGIINTRTKGAAFKNLNEVGFRIGSWGSYRGTADFNRVLLKDELALRVAGVYDDTKYKQDPAFAKSERLFGALRYEPGFLKKGSARTILKGNIEWGNLTSNSPRQLPPIDGITPWFQTGTFVGRDVNNPFTTLTPGGQPTIPTTFNNLNRLTLIPSQNEDDNTGLPNHGQNRPSHNGPAEIGGQSNQYYQPWVGRSFGGQFGNPSFLFNGDNAVQSTGILWEPTTYHGMSPNGVNGTRNTGISGMPFQRPAGVANYADFAQNARLPFYASGVYKDKSITDPSIFDFYNELLDGPTKREWQNFRAYNISLAQTFLHDHVGFEGTYYNEWYANGNTRLLSGDQQAITVDMSSVYSDGTPTGKNGEPFADGTVNPNVGRPVVSDSGAFGNNSHVSDREDKRLTVFGDYDFNEGKKNWFTHLLGRHVVNGLLSDDTQTTDDRSWARYTVKDDAWQKMNNTRLPTDPLYVPLGFMSAQMLPYSYVYLGPTLKGASSAVGANIPRPTSNPTITNGNVRFFDATWKPSTTPGNPGYVDPAAYWHYDYYPINNPITGAPFAPTGDSTQSENPANYVGYRNVPISILDSESDPLNRIANTHDARLTKSTVSSQAFNWQAHFWDNAVVATWGIRKDIAKSWQFSLNTSSSSSLPTNNYRLNLDPSNYKLKADPDNRIEVTSRAWTIVAHLNQLPGLSKLPLQVSLFYNHSTDFQPAANRVDIYGEPLAAPSGVTKDMGILLESQDGKYSLKVNKYETTSTNQSSSALQYSWFIGSAQAWAANWVNRFEFNWTADNNSGAVAVNDPTNSEYNYDRAPGESLADAQAREASVIASWRTWQKSVDPRFYKAWGINLNDPTKAVSSTQPNGFTVTEDSHSEGYEIEFNANPTKNWRLTFNASQAEAQRTNIGGTNLIAFVNAYTKALNNGAKGGVGDLRIWWGGAGNETTLLEWYSGNQPFGSVYTQRHLQEGSNVPELREWRYNAITNYDFDRGALKGFNVGGGVRYESSIVIGYKPILIDANQPDYPGNTSYDLANPYEGPAETYFDLWVGYHRRIWKNIDWNIQLNVRNVGVGNTLIPITTEPDGSPATYRIKPPQVMQLTNTFRF